jgi:hypothetical protein
MGVWMLPCARVDQIKAEGKSGGPQRHAIADVSRETSWVPAFVRRRVFDPTQGAANS